MGFFTLLVLLLVAVTLVKTTRNKAPSHAPAPEDTPSAAPATEPVPSPAAAEPPAAPAFWAGLTGYFHGNWAKDGAIYQALDEMPITCFTVQLTPDRLIESITLEGQSAPLVNETNYTTLCPADAIPDFSDPTRQKAVWTALAAELVSLGTLRQTGDAFFPIRSTPTPAPKPAQPPCSKGSLWQEKGYEALRSQMQTMLEQMAKDKPNR